MGQQFVLSRSGRNGSATAGADDVGGNGVTHAPLPRIADEDELLAAWRQEIADMQNELVVIAEDDPDEIMRRLGGWQARLVEMRSQTWDLRGNKATQLRTRHIDPTLEGFSKVFDTISRRLAAIEVELKFCRGMT